MFIKTESIPMTGSARDSLIAISVLWVVFAVIVGFRLLGRFQGMGFGLDDVLSVVALVGDPNASFIAEPPLTVLYSSYPEAQSA
jgi:hypothetical protein